MLVTGDRHRLVGEPRDRLASFETRLAGQYRRYELHMYKLELELRTEGIVDICSWSGEIKGSS